MRDPGSWLLLGALSLLGSACAPTETGNPPEDRKVLLGATSSDPDAVAVAPARGAVVIESAWHAVNAFGYIACGGEVVWVDQEPHAVELVSGRGVAVTGDVPAGSYCTLLLPTSPLAAEAGVPVALQSYTFYLTGRRADGRRFEVVGDNIGLEKPFAAGMLELDASSPPLLLGLDVARLYPLLGVETAAPAADGVVRVDKSLTGDPGSFHVDWQSSWALHADENRNGRVDADEPDLF